MSVSLFYYVSLYFFPALLLLYICTAFLGILLHGLPPRPQFQTNFIRTHFPYFTLLLSHPIPTVRNYATSQHPHTLYYPHLVAIDPLQASFEAVSFYILYDLPFIMAEKVYNVARGWVPPWKVTQALAKAVALAIKVAMFLVVGSAELVVKGGVVAAKWVDRFS
ncbi:hypothetical protein BDZ91DRAFT_768299 [Kalaharituber pfeilii]|nr:hypothetical protein BDZ91DRAFT_768299 [Kalaharituber pfeilii]